VSVTVLNKCPTTALRPLHFYFTFRVLISLNQEKEISFAIVALPQYVSQQLTNIFHFVGYKGDLTVITRFTFFRSQAWVVSSPSCDTLLV
jgi:hypothetical protein